MTHSEAIRFVKKLVPGDMFNGSSCWLWAAGRVHNGYGQFKIGGRHQYAHRVSWEAANGPIPPRLQVDHLCRVRHCVNPRHMEVVTNRQNSLRGIGFSAINSRKTHCPSGHAYSEKNTGKGHRGQRYCKACICAKSRINRAKANDARPGR